MFKYSNELIILLCWFAKPKWISSKVLKHKSRSRVRKPRGR